MMRHLVRSLLVVLGSSLAAQAEEPVKTFAYIYNLDGSLTFLCHSLAYGVPYGAGHDSKVVAKATWVICIDPKDGKGKMTYVEPHVVVAPFQLGAENSFELPTDSLEIEAEKETKP